MAKLKKVFLIETVVGIILASENRPVLKDVLKATAVKQGSYAAELVERIYAFFIDTAIDLTAEYQKFYKPEFKDMSNFLYHKYAMDEEDLSRLLALRKPYNCLLLIKGIQWGRDYQIDSLFEHSERGRGMIMKILNATFIGEVDED